MIQKDQPKATALYFFADHCLQICGDIFWYDWPLDAFTKKKPHTTKSNLSIEAKSWVDNATLLANEAGVCISQGSSTGWLFASSDKKNPCAIKTNQDYTILKGYLDLSNCKNEKRLRDNFLQLLRVASECLFCGHGGLSVHASCVIFKGRAILFTAPSGTGKSTQASHWQKKMGAFILSGDRPHLRVGPEGVQVYGVPWDGKEQCYVQESYPIAAIIEIRQAKTNRLRELGPEQAFRLLLQQSFIPMWDDNTKFLAVQTIRALSQQLSFYRLFCNLEQDAVSSVADAVFNKKVDIKEKSEVDMRIKDGFILRNIADEWFAMPKGTNIKNFEGAVMLNEVSAHIWQQLEKPISKTDLLQLVLDEFAIEKEVARGDLEEFLDQLRSLDILIDD